MKVLNETWSEGAMSKGGVINFEAGFFSNYVIGLFFNYFFLNYFHQSLQLGSLYPESLDILLVNLEDSNSDMFLELPITNHLWVASGHWIAYKIEYDDVSKPEDARVVVVSIVDSANAMTRVSNGAKKDSCILRYAIT